jgi:hypothetical protein
LPWRTPPFFVGCKQYVPDFENRYEAVRLAGGLLEGKRALDWNARTEAKCGRFQRFRTITPLSPAEGPTTGACGTFLTLIF